MSTVHHACTIEHQPSHGVFEACCAICGPVGQPQRWEVDAIAIASRHEEVGGFER